MTQQELNQFEEINTPSFLVSISKETWFQLRRDPKFFEHWKNSGALYHLTVLCMMKNLTQNQMLTVLYIHQKKHGRQFSPKRWDRDIHGRAFEYSYPIVSRWQANEYWKERRRICTDKKARLHSKLRVAYYLMNIVQATISEIVDATGMALKTVQNSVAALKDACKVTMPETGVYKARQSFYWDRCGLITSPDGLKTCVDDSDDEHSAMAYWGQTINERHPSGDLIYMPVYNYTKDRMENAVYDAGQMFRGLDPLREEWVVNHEGQLVANGGQYGGPIRFASLLRLGSSVEFLNGNRLDLRACNVVAKPIVNVGQVRYPTVDYFAKLMAA